MIPYYKVLLFYLYRLELDANQKIRFDAPNLNLDTVKPPSPTLWVLSDLETEP